MIADVLIHLSQSYFLNNHVETRNGNRFCLTDVSMQLIQSYVLNTHAKTHNQYTMTVDEVFDLDKEGEKLRFKDVGNR